jgi:tRNA A58 N-methylase Trm61
MITVIGIFADPALAEQAGDYLLANEFEDENVDRHTYDPTDTGEDRVGGLFSHLYDNQDEAEHYASLARNGTVITVHAASTREAQEAVDALNNHGAIDVDAQANRSLLIEKVIAPELRLRG